MYYLSTFKQVNVLKTLSCLLSEANAPIQISLISMSWQCNTKKSRTWSQIPVVLHFPVFKQKTKESTLPVPEETQMEVFESLSHLYQELAHPSKAIN